MTDVKEWLTARELAELKLPGLPADLSSVIKRAKRESWVSRERTGSGGGREYPLSALPETARIEYVRRAMAATGALLAVAAPPVPAPVAAPVAAPADVSVPAAAQRDARLAILTALDRYTAVSGLSRARADALFCAAYAAGEIEVAGWVRAAVKTVSRATLFRWRSALKAGAPQRLAIDKGASRRGTGVLETANGGAVSDAVLGLIAARPWLSAHQVRRILIGTFGAELAAADGELVPMPALRTIRLHMQELRSTHAQQLLHETDPDGWRSRYRLSGVSKHLVFRPLEIVAGDASPADVLLTDGRHSIYVAIDYFSRRALILVTKTPRAAAVLLLLRRVILEWGVPELFHTDNGSDFVADATQRFLASAGIDTLRARPFEPNDKAKVERAIKTVQHDLMTLLAGYAGHSVAERKRIEGRKAFAKRLGETESKLLEVKLTAAELQSACDRWVTTAYDNQLHSTLGTTPLMKWGEYTGKIRRIADERALDVLLMPIAGKSPVRKVQNRGIPVENGWFVPPPGVLPGAQVFCRQHPTDFGKLLVFTPDQATYLGEAECPERTGTSRAAITAHRQAVQNRIVKEGRADLRRKQREYARPEVVFESYLKGAAAEAPNVTPLLNRHSTPVSTPALDAAAAATQPRRHDRTVTLDAKVGARMEAEFEASLAGQAPAQVLPFGSDEARFLRALDMEARAAAGEALAEADARWLASYRRSAKCQSFQGFFEEYGREWFEDRVAG